MSRCIHVRNRNRGAASQIRLRARTSDEPAGAEAHLARPHQQLLAHGGPIVDTLAERAPDVAALLRIALAEVESGASEAARTRDPDAARRHWSRCALGESALLLAAQEARRRRRITSDAYRGLRAAAIAARHYRHQATRGRSHS